MIDSEVKFIKCVVTCDTMSIMRGDNCMLPHQKARLLEAMGAVKIIDKQKSNKNNDAGYMYHYSFSKRPSTRVVWLQNYVKEGGAEISNYRCVSVGRNLGFDIVGVDIDDVRGYELLRKADVIIVNNLHAAGREKALEYLSRTTIPYIKYEHDMLEVEPSLFINSKLNVFISPMQREFYSRSLGIDLSEKSICLPLAIDPDRWEYKANGRVPDSVFIPAYGKCRDNAMQFIAENPGKKVAIAGNVKPLAGNVECIGEVPHGKMSEFYHRFETVYHCPHHRYAGDRVVFEAVLCGCKLITSEHAGHTSWDFDWRDHGVLRPRLREAVYEFWRQVEGVVNAA